MVPDDDDDDDDDGDDYDIQNDHDWLKILLRHSCTYTHWHKYIIIPARKHIVFYLVLVCLFGEGWWSRVGQQVSDFDWHCSYCSYLHESFISTILLLLWCQLHRKWPAVPFFRYVICVSYFVTAMKRFAGSIITAWNTKWRSLNVMHQYHHNHVDEGVF